MAQGKVASQWTCAKSTVAHSIDAGDQPNHSFVISQSNCTASKGEIEGVKDKEGMATQFNEVTGAASSWHGVFVVTMANGDKVHYSFKGRGTTKDGNFESGSNAWAITNGTGKFAGAKGEGSCKGKGNADGSATWDCAGSYVLGK
jgi:hypothetical protein